MTFQRRNIHPDGLFKRVVSGHQLYSPVVTVEGCRLVFVSGLLARNQAGEIIRRGDMGAQIAQVGENLRVALEAAGAKLDDPVRTTTYVTDIDEYFRHMEVRQRYFFALPTSTAVEVRRLSHPDFMVEVEAFAAIPL
jgi:enamine deaminase RidA (YjgF/YER057c/UK114 family)